MMLATAAAPQVTTPRLHPDRPWIRSLRLVVALLILAAITTNTVEAFLGTSGTLPGQLWSYFTIHSNLLLAVAFAVGALVPRAQLPTWWDTARGAAAYYMVMTGIIYVVLIAPPEELLMWNIGWTGIVEHRIGPWAAFLDWALVLIAGRAGWKRPLSWLAYPIVFLVLTMLRGAITGWYPYHFLDPLQAGGWSGVFTLTGIVIVAFLVMAAVVHLIGVARSAIAARDRSLPRSQPRSQPE